MLTLEQAAAKVARDAEASREPVVEPGEVKDIVEETTFAAVHAVSTAYPYGAVIVPPTTNGRMYRAVIGGTSGETAPNFASFWCAFGYSGYLFSDGTVTWEDAGPAYPELYNVREATRKVLLLKLSRCYGDVDLSFSPSSDLGSVKRSQKSEHIEKLLAHYAPINVF